MKLSWNEVRARAARFSAEWKDAAYEKGETQSFYNEFFEIFGVKRRKVASFEEPVKKLGNKQGFIDLFWKGVLLVEQKSSGRSLKPAKTQAFDYFPGIKDYELPRYLLLSDFQTFELYDLDENGCVSFPLVDLHKHVEDFAFILGYQKQKYRDQDPVNIKAAELMGRLHDALEQSRYRGHKLEKFLVRLLFCLFADDTGIFEPRDIFTDLIENRTTEDGANVGQWIAQLFETLDTPEDERQSNLDADLAAFPYINGGLFEGGLPIPQFNAEMREILLEACRFNWSAISPAIFGALFQSVMDKEERRKSGGHYTTEKNIRKVIEPLFMEELIAEFEKIKALKRGRSQALEAFHTKLSKIQFFDPACGCGNFLIVTYREIRELELKLLREIYPTGQQVLDVAALSKINVSQFYGIEIGEFPARIAEVALWMMDHIENVHLSHEFGQAFARIPLKASPHIVNDNALRVDWSSIVDIKEPLYILGNPPFIGHQYRDKGQVHDMEAIWGKGERFGRLDYVACWYILAARLMANAKHVKTAFVSTNSITQGEQVGILWTAIWAQKVEISFAHRTFQWSSDARGRAAVHCVIIGMAAESIGQRRIYDYVHLSAEPTMATVSNINGYLVDGRNIAIASRARPLPGQLKMMKGSQPTDGARLKTQGGGYETFSNLILDDANRTELLAAEPAAAAWLRPYVGGDELISEEWRWCLWLKDISPADLKKLPQVQERLKRVSSGRLKSDTASVRAFAKYPTLFTQDRQPSTDYLAIPEVSSETRHYIPIALLGSDVIASNKLQIIPGAGLLHFAILTSEMHMAWVRAVSGRLKSDYSYSPAVYYSFVWPEISPEAQKRLEKLGQAVLDTRAAFVGSTLADLYDPTLMPPALQKAHGAVDKAVETLYRRGGFATEGERVEHLFKLYEARSVPLVVAAGKRARKGK